MSSRPGSYLQKQADLQSGSRILGLAVELVTGGSSVAQGIATAMAQICADALGVDYRRLISVGTDRPHSIRHCPLEP
jgi:CO/xanthine dehydrogenase Mo-binding subunit